MGKYDLKSLIQIRRLMYLWQILNRKKSELIRRVYESQKILNGIGDWIRLIEADKKELRIAMTDQEIENESHDKFKNYVKMKVKTKHLALLNERKEKHSKSKFLNCNELKMAEYLKDPVLNTKQKQLLFKLRSRTLDVKGNFPGQHKDLLCISCGLFPELQSHILQCPQLVTRVGHLMGNTSELNENDVYKDLEKQRIIVNIYSDLLEVRERLKIENISLSHSEGPVHSGAA